MTRTRPAAQDAADLMERLHRLRILLPAMAQDTAMARREAAQLRIENGQLMRRVAELEDLLAMRAAPPFR